MGKKNGFSLIEVLIVLGILAAVMSAVIGRPKNTQKDYTRFFRRYSLLSKKIRNQAMMENATYRIVFDVTEDKPFRAIVQKAKKAVLLGSEKDSKEKFQKLLKSVRKKKKSKKEDKKEKQKDGFQDSNRFNFNALKPPRGLKIKKIEVSGISDPLIDDGVIAYHYFPHGLVEETVIHFIAEGTDLKWTVVSEPINGEFVQMGGHKELKDLQRK